MNREEDRELPDVSTTHADSRLGDKDRIVARRRNPKPVLVQVPDLRDNPKHKGYYISKGDLIALCTVWFGLLILIAFVTLPIMTVMRCDVNNKFCTYKKVSVVEWLLEK